MNNRIVTSLCVLCAILCAIQRASAQGSLTPPGAPAPTMKSLSQVEPRTAITSAPYTISSPGSYYLTTNVTGVSGTNGITIASGNVTLDLRGFTLSGVPGSLKGIYVTGAYSNLTVENGTVVGWGSIGVDADNGAGGQFSHLRFVGNASDGLDPGQVGQVRDCIASRNGGDGFGGVCSNTKFGDCTSAGNSGEGFSTYEGCLFRSCSASFNGFDGFNLFYHCIMTDCVAHDNGFDGVDTPYPGCVVVGCVCDNNGSQGIIAGDGCTIKDSVVVGNALNGIIAGLDCSVLACTVQTNRAAGIVVDANSSVKDCTVSGNSADGIDVNGKNCTVTDCTASGNYGEGINVAGNCTVKDCTASGNYEGIYVFGNNCQIAGNTCSGNSLYGVEIYGVQNRIDGNSVGNNTSYGINPDTANVTNNITRNSSPGPGYGNYAGNNDYAPTGSVHTATNPWTNF
jgi:parallel beta-helix repeat protein